MGMVGDLVVNLGVNSRSFTSGLNAARGTLGSFSGSVGSVLKTVTGLGIGLLGVGTAVKGMTEVGQAFGDIDRIAKSAQSFGVTTEEMVGLEHAASLSGVSAETLAKAMQKATREGLNLADVADTMAAIDDPSERAAYAFKTLGKNGQELIPLLSAGGDALRKMMEEGNRLAGFSGVDAAKVEEANDAITRMQLAFTGVAREIAIAVAPAVETIAVKVQQWGEAAKPIIQSVIETFNFGIRNAADLWTLGLTEMSLFVIKWGADIAVPIIAIWDGAMAAFGAFFTNIKGGLTEIGNLAQALGTAVKAAFTAAFSGENPVTAFKDSFIEALAAQQDAVSAGNPAEAFVDAFKKSSADTRGFFDNMQTGLLEDRDRVMANIAKTEAGFTAQQANEAVSTAPSTFLASDTQGTTDKAKIAGGAERGSKEALDRILKAGAREKNPVLKVNEKQLAESKLQTAALQAMVKTPPAVVVGTI